MAGVLLGAKTNSITGALTVAGQWRNFTAFPSILTIAIVDYAAPQGSRNDDAMNAISMASTFINGPGHEVKTHPFERRCPSAREQPETPRAVKTELFCVCGNTPASSDCHVERFCERARL